MANLDNVEQLAIERIIKDLNEDLASYKRSIKNLRERAKARRKLLPQRLQTVKTLFALGVITIDNDEPSNALARLASGTSWYDSVNVTGKLGPLRTLYGSEFVELDETTKQEQSKADNTVRVSLKKSKDYVGPDLYVIITLDENSKCQYVTRTVTTTDLVCKNPNE